MRNKFIKIKQKAAWFLLLVFVISDFSVFEVAIAGASTAWWTDINEPTVWTLANSPYVIPMDTVIKVNNLLSIEPGVIVKFTPDHRNRRYSGLTVNGPQGKIIGQGQDQSSIVMTSYYDHNYAVEIGNDKNAQLGDWYGIVFKNDQSILENVIVRYAGANNKRVASMEFVDGSQAVVSSSFVEYSQGSGIDIAGGAKPLFDNMKIENSAYAAIKAESTAGLGILKNSFIQNNANYPIFDINVNSLFRFENNTYFNNSFQTALLSGKATGNVVWQDLGVPYVCRSAIEIAAGAKATVAQGVVLKFDDANRFVRMLVKGSLESIGTDSRPVIFTSIKDDILNDSNNDGNASLPAAGDWGEIAFINSSGSKLAYTEIRYAGDYHGDFSGMVYGTNDHNSVLLNNSHVEFDNVIVNHGSDFGILQKNGGILAVDNSKIINHKIGVYVENDADGLCAIKNSEIYNNSNYGLYYSGTHLFNAKNNWWGHESGPEHIDNPGAIGNRIFGNVDFKPWLGQKPSLIPFWRVDIQPGDILYDPYSAGVGHTGLYIGDDWVIEAQGDPKHPKDAELSRVKRNNISSWDYPNRKNVHLLRVKRPDNISEQEMQNKIDSAVQFVKDQYSPIAKPYDWYWTHKNSSVDAPSWYCSELVWASYFNQGIDLEFAPAYGAISPVSPAEIFLDDDTYAINGHHEYNGGWKDYVFLLVKSPVEVVVTAPDGKTMAKELIDISGATYIEDYFDPQTWEIYDLISLPSVSGEYQVTVSPGQGADPLSDVYGLIIEAGDKSGQIILAQNEPVPAVGDSHNYSFDASSFNDGAGFFDNEMSGENTYAAGSLDFSLDAPSDFLIGLKPGKAVDRQIEIVNNSSLDFQYKVEIGGMNGNLALCNAIEMDVNLNGNNVYHGDLLGLSSVAMADLGFLDFEVSLIESEADLQNQECSFDFVFTGWQKNFTDETQGFFDVETVSGTVRSGEWIMEEEAQIVLNEILPNPEGSDGQQGLLGEWVELYNNGGAEVDVSGWYIKDGSISGNQQTVTASSTLDSRIVIGVKGSGAEWLVLFMAGAVLNNTGDIIILYDSFGNQKDSYSFGASSNDEDEDINNTPDEDNSGYGGNETAGDEGKSYGRIPDGIGDWVDPIPTPGQVNEP